MASDGAIVSLITAFGITGLPSTPPPLSSAMTHRERSCTLELMAPAGAMATSAV